jgi:hypothetical protein
LLSFSSVASYFDLIGISICAADWIGLVLIPRQGPALTMPSGKGELLAGGIKRFGPLLGDVVFSGEEGVGEGGVGEGGGGIKVPSFSGGSGSGVLLGIGIGVGAGKGVGGGSGSGVLLGIGIGVGAGKGVGGGSGSGVLLGIGIGVGAGVGMGAYTGSLIGLGSGTFEVTGAGLDNPGEGMIMVEVGGRVCVSTEGALRR